MRDELEQLEQIERYLSAAMTPQEVEAFEAQMQADPELLAKVDAQRALLQGMERAALRQDVQRSAKQYRMRRIRKFGTIAGLAVLGLAVLALLWYQERAVDKHAIQLREDALPVQIFSIDIRKDTLLRTAGGVLIEVPAGSIEAKKGDRAQLQVQEALQVSEMVQAGLLTRAGREPLSSGGMIAIRPAPGQDLQIRKELRIAMPTTYRKPGMLVWEGKQGEDGRINWQDAYRLDSIATAQDLEQGRQLFMANCATCHNPVRDATGPSLVHIRRDRDWTWLRRFVANPSGLIASGDPMANAVFCNYRPTVMTAFPCIKESELRSIFDYVDSKAEGEGPDRENLRAVVDSCRQYRKLRNQVLGRGAQEPGSLSDAAIAKELEANALLCASRNEGSPARSDTASAATELVMPDAGDVSYYRFQIAAFGWYNVDVLMKDLPGFVSSELWVRVDAASSGRASVSLVIPSEKVFVNAFLSDDPQKRYAFYTMDGQIPLPQVQQLYVLATRSEGDQLYFAMHPFTARSSQELQLQLRPTSPEALRKTLQQLDLPNGGLQLDTLRTVVQTQQAGNNNSLAEAESWIPKGADCACLLGERDSVVEVWDAGLNFVERAQ